MRAYVVATSRLADKANYDFQKLGVEDIIAIHPFQSVRGMLFETIEITEGAQHILESMKPLAKFATITRWKNRLETDGYFLSANSYADVLN